MKEKGCRRCGFIGNLEKHHKKHKVAGGSDANPNRIWYCQSCHDYIHAHDAVVAGIKAEEERLRVLKTRLEIIERENTPEAIRQRGYQPYFALYDEALPARTKCIRV